MGRKNNIEGQLNLFDLWTNEQAEPDDYADAIESADVAESAGASNSRVPSGQNSYPECAVCWCATCEHSSKGGGKPRPFGDAERVCPSCEICAKEGKADVCVIGSAEEGCRFRAEKEGLVEVYEEE